MLARLEPAVGATVRSLQVTGLRARWIDGLSGTALLATSVLAPGLGHAQPASMAATSEASSAPLSIWYRSSEGCPDGGVFVARLAELGRRATLARVGDRVDFVVTVAAAPSGSSGRLERQTTRGTVAIRELAAQRCEEVTEALALSLEIALDPASEVAGSTGAASVGRNAADASSPSAALSAPPGGTPEVVDAGHARIDEQRNRHWLALGAQASVLRGMAPGWAPGGAVFAELRANDAPALTGRLSFAAALASDTVSAVAVDVLWLAGRAEGCVFELRSGRLSLQPCLGVELGRLRGGSSGGGGRADSGVWGAGVGLARGSIELDAGLALEAQVSASVPFVRYRVGSSLGGDLFRTEPVVAGLTFGVRWSP